MCVCVCVCVCACVCVCVCVHVLHQTSASASERDWFRRVLSFFTVCDGFDDVWSMLASTSRAPPTAVDTDRLVHTRQLVAVTRVRFIVVILSPVICKVYAHAVEQKRAQMHWLRSDTDVRGKPGL